MVIQSFNVSVSSQRTFLSIQSSAITAENNKNTAQHAGVTGQEASTQAIPNQVAGRKNYNENGQGQNQNGQGQNNDRGQNENGQGQNVNNQGQNVNNQGQNQDGQGQNVNNQGQNNDEAFKDALKKAQHERDEAVRQLGRPSRTSRMSANKHQRTPATPQELRARISQLIYELLTGRGFKPKQPPQIENIGDWRGIDMFSFFGGIFGVGSAERAQGVNGLLLEHFQYESETVSYQAKGVVHTADGKEISIDINMNVSREFASYMNISLERSTLLDPLIINYGGTAASLTGERFMFDLTMDGNPDSIAVLGEGSGFLAIDRNGDGIINDGSELFGPSTGCGFSELRKYDTDGNGWIDENDEIYDKLVVWKRDKDGNDTVKTLRELGIGAIFLGDISTEYSFKGENNETLGVMRTTSFFIKECGSTGTLSHIDLAL